MENKINVKDLINVGIFTALNFIMFFISGMLCYIPVFTIVLPCNTAILAGIPFILFLTKTDKFGMVTIMGSILGLFTFVMGYGWIGIATGVICGLLADLIFKSGGYKSWKRTLLGYCVFSQWVVGSMLPMWITTDNYFEQISQGKCSNEYVAALKPLVTNYSLAAVIALGIVGAIIGAYLGRITLKKHFKRAGIV